MGANSIWLRHRSHIGKWSAWRDLDLGWTLHGARHGRRRPWHFWRGRSWGMAPLTAAIKMKLSIPRVLISDTRVVAGLPRTGSPYPRISPFVLPSVVDVANRVAFAVKITPYPAVPIQYRGNGSAPSMLLAVIPIALPPRSHSPHDSSPLFRQSPATPRIPRVRTRLCSHSRA